VGAVTIHPGQPFGGVSFHLETVGHGVDGPGIFGIEAYGAAAQGLGVVIGAVFLQGKGMDAQELAVAGRGLGPLGREGVHHRAHGGAAAGVEVAELGQLQGEEVLGVVDKDGVPEAPSLGFVMAHPSGEGLGVGLLPRVPLGREGLGLRRGGLGDGAKLPLPR